MQFPKIINPGVYRHAQIGSQRTHAPWISFGISGLVRNTVYYPDGSFCSSFDRAKDGPMKPILNLSVPGFYSEFEYDSTRENYVIILSEDFRGFQFDNATHSMLLDYNGTLLPVPRSILVAASEIPALRETFQTIMELYLSAIPCNQLAAEIMVANLLLRFLQTRDDSDDPVEQLRKMIDSDTKWERSISGMCAELGFGRDTLRKEFQERYKIQPGEYRIRKRLRRIEQLFAYSGMTLKEIAFETGMKNVTHLNAIVRKYFGKTPSGMCREYRQKDAR